MIQLAAKLLAAQILIAPEQATKLAREFEAKEYPKVACAIGKAPSRLTYSLTHWAGFGLELPLKQFREAAVDLGIAVEITPEGERPVYLGERIVIPAAPEGLKRPKDAAIQYVGGYFLGPGKYRVRTIAFVKEGACRKDWTVRIKAGKEPIGLEPNQVAPVGGQRWRGLQRTGPRRKVTVILEAAPLSPRRAMVRLSSYDRGALLTSLTTMLDKAGFTHAAVVAADSRNQKVVFSSADFNPRELRRLGRALDEVNLGTISMKTLQGPGPDVFFGSVLDGAASSARESEAVVFLGPAWSWQGRLTPRLREVAGTFPPMHYLALTRWAAVDDNLPARFVKSANGSARQVFTAEDLAKAIERIGKK